MTRANCMNLHKWTPPFWAKSVNCHVVVCRQCGRSRKATEAEVERLAKLQNSWPIPLPTSAEDTEVHDLPPTTALPEETQ